MKAFLFGCCGLLTGGLLYLAAPAAAPAAPAPAASPKAAVPSPEATVKRLEAAVQRGDIEAVKAILADEPDNQGREELIAALELHEVASRLDREADEQFGPGPSVSQEKPWMRDLRIEVVSKEFVCGMYLLDLRITMREPGKPDLTYEKACEVGVDGKLTLYEGFFSFHEEKERQLTLNLARYLTQLYGVTTYSLEEGRFHSREEVSRHLQEEAQTAEPVQQFLAYALEKARPEIIRAIDEAIKRALEEALMK